MSQQYYSRGPRQARPAGQRQVRYDQYGQMEQQYHDPRFRPPSLTPLRIASIILGGGCLILFVLMVRSCGAHSRAEQGLRDEMAKTGNLERDRAYYKAKADELEAKLRSARMARPKGGKITPPPDAPVGSALYWKAMYLEAERQMKGNKMQALKSEANLKLVGKKGVESVLDPKLREAARRRR